MATLARQLARAEAERDEAIEFAASVEDLDEEYRRVRDAHLLDADKIHRLEVEVDYERLQRASAQRGLKWYIEEFQVFAAYLRNRGQDDLVAQLRYRGLVVEIGYDLEMDGVIQKAVEDGEIPPRTDPVVAREIAALVVEKAG